MLLGKGLGHVCMVYSWKVTKRREQLREGTIADFQQVLKKVRFDKNMFGICAIFVWAISAINLIL